MGTWIFEEHEYNIYIFFFTIISLVLILDFFLNVHIVDKNTHFR